MGERPGRSSGFVAHSARWALGAALLAIAFSAVAASYQKSPVPILVASALFLAGALARPPVAVVVAAAAVALLPITGNLLAGPWIAPAELLLLLLAAATVFRHAETPASPVRRALVVSALAMAAGAVAATLAALAPAEIPAAIRDLSGSFFAAGTGHAALPLRAALVNAAGLLGFLLFRRAAAERGAGTLLLAVVGGLALVGAFSVVEASTGLKLWGAALYELHSRGLRVPSTLPDYNATGAAMALGLFPAIALAREARGARRVALTAVSALLLAGLLLSGSRGAWLAAFAAAAAALAGALGSRHGAGPRERRRLALGAVLALGVAFASIMAWPGDVGGLLRRRAATLVDPSASLDAVRAGRVGFWMAGVRMAVAHPLAGVGPGRAPARFEEFRDPAFPVAAENVHNYFLQAIAENGLPGGLLVLWPLVPLAFVAGRLLATGAALSSPLAALAPGLLAFSLTGFASHPWLLPEMQFLFWGAAALLPEANAPAGGTGVAGSLRRVLPWAVLVAWAVPRLLTAPGTERGRFGYGEWDSRGSSARYFWTGPHALVRVDLPGEGAVRVRIRGMLPDVEERPLVASLRLDGGPARRISLPDPSWHDVVMVRGPFREGDAAGGGGRRALLRIETSRGFCPARDGGEDRRVLSVQLARPPVSSPGAPPP